MGRKSRMKKMYSARARKAINEMLKDASPEPYSKRDESGNVSIQYYNPLKKLMKGEAYSSEDGKRITKDMAEKYMNFLKSKMEERKAAAAGTAEVKEETNEGQS
jgi:hypothetical protein